MLVIVVVLGSSIWVVVLGFVAGRGERASILL
jgi:hypothetical protein